MHAENEREGALTSIRIPGWLTDGTIKVPADTVQAMAELVGTVRDLTVENARLEAHGVALKALVEAITRHGFGSEQVVDAYREGLRAINGKP